MRIAVTGASGLIGSALVPALRDGGHEVLRLVRRTAQASDEVAWDPGAGTVDAAALAGVEAVVHLAGVGIGSRRWTDEHKRAVVDSRVDGTTTIATALAGLDPLPRVLVSASAVGFYGDTGDAAVDETAPSGGDWLADVVRRWEAATAPAEAAGIRVVHARSGVVLSSDGGTLGDGVPVFGVARVRLTTLFKAGLGGPLGSGRQWMSWITLADEVAALRFLLTAEELRGPVNLTAPAPCTNRQWVHAIGRALHRPAVLPVPGFALRLAIGEFADAGVLVSQRVVPHRLEAAGFDFAHRDVDTAMAAVL